MRSSRIRPMAVPLLAALLVAGAAAGCGEKRPVNPAAETGELPDQEVSDFVLTETDQGTPSWTLYARYAATYNARNTITARAVRVDFFDREGESTSTLTAREGEIHQSTRNMVARGDVVLRSEDGTRMATDELRFLNQTQRILVPDDRLVRVERAGDVLTGYGFESDPELRHFEFKRRVTATVRTRSGGVVDAPGETR
jgi:LPS export ABC transporter protein LptC